MPLELSILEEDDIPAFARIDEAAMAGWPLAEAMSINSSVPRRQLVEGWVRKGFQTDSTQTYLKVTDTDTDEIIACALWRIDPDGQHEKAEREVPAPVEGEGGQKGKEARLGSVMEAMAAGWKDFQSQFFPNTPHASPSPSPRKIPKSSLLTPHRPPNPNHRPRAPTPRRGQHARGLGLPARRRARAHQCAHGLGSRAEGLP